MTPLRSRVLTDPADIAAAKLLQGHAYVRHGHIAAGSLTPQGFLPWHDDPADAAMTWFGVFDPGAGGVPGGRRADGGRLVATARIICGPTLPALMGERAGPGVVEPAGLAKLPGVPSLATLMIFREFYRHSLRRGHLRWVMTVAPTLRETLLRELPGAVTFGGEPVRVDFPGVRADLLVHPAGADVAAIVPGIRRSGGHAVADFLEAE